MKTLYQFWIDRQLTAMSKWQIKHVILTVILFAGLIAGIVRACSSMGSNHNSLYRIARDASWNNLQFAEKGVNALAFSNDLLFAIAKEEDVQFELLFVQPDNLLPGLDRGQFDGILSTMQPSSKDWYLATNPIYLTGPILIVRTGSNATSLSDMEGKSIGIQTGSSTVFSVEKYPEILISSYDTPLQALADLDKNTIDGVILPIIPAYIYTTGLYAGRLKIAGGPLSHEGIRLITLNNTRGEHLEELFNKGLAALKSDGSYHNLLVKWNLFNPEEGTKTDTGK